MLGEKREKRMREVLFRGKRVDNGEWVEGAYYKEPYTDKAFIIRWNSTGLGFNEFIEVDGETVGQCSGVPDKNGKKMFEGDVVRLTISKVEKFNSVCKFDGGAFGLEWWWMGVARFNSFTSICHTEFEVIGNVHDNPELLKEVDHAE